MALIVEDGSIVDSANTYVTAETVDSYCSLRALSTWASAATVDKEAAIIRAMDFIDSHEFKGVKTFFDNPLEWPRSGWFYESIVDEARSYTIQDYEATIPDKLKQALCRAAYEELADPGCFQKKLTQDDFVTSRDIAGAISLTYDQGGIGPAEYPAVENLLKELLRGTEVRVVRT